MGSYIITDDFLSRPKQIVTGKPIRNRKAIKAKRKQK
jgi:hypothetical protein